MGNINKGQQTIIWKFETPIDSDHLNQLFYKVIKAGVYEGMELIREDDTTVQITAGVMVIQDKDGRPQTLRISTDANTFAVGVSPAEPVIVWRYQYAKADSVYADIIVTDRPSVLPTDIVLGEALFTGTTMLETFDSAQRSVGFQTEVRNILDRFRVTAIEASRNVLVGSGFASFGDSSFSFDESDTSSITDPPWSGLGFQPIATPGYSRIDLLFINTSGELEIEQGGESVTPNPPAHQQRFVLAEVFIVVGQSAILQRDIKDVRPWFYVPQILLEALEQQAQVFERTSGDGVLVGVDDELKVIPSDYDESNNNMDVGVSTGRGLVKGDFASLVLAETHSIPPADEVEVGDSANFLTDLSQGTISGVAGTGANEVVTGNGTAFLYDRDNLGMKLGDYFHIGGTGGNVLGQIVSIESDILMHIDRSMPEVDTTNYNNVSAQFSDWERLYLPGDQQLNCNPDNDISHKIVYEGNHKVLPSEIGSVLIRSLEGDDTFVVHYNKMIATTQFSVNTYTGEISGNPDEVLPNTIRVSYRYGLPRYDIVEMDTANTVHILKGVAVEDYSTLERVAGTVSRLTLAHILVDECQGSIVADNIYDARKFAQDKREGVTPLDEAPGNEFNLTDLHPSLIAHLSGDTNNIVNGDDLPCSITGDKWSPVDGKIALCGVESENLLHWSDLIKDAHRFEELFSSTHLDAFSIEPDTIDGKPVQKVVFNNSNPDEYGSQVTLFINKVGLGEDFEPGEDYIFRYMIRTNVNLVTVVGKDDCLLSDDSGSIGNFNTNKWTWVERNFHLDSVGVDVKLYPFVLAPNANNLYAKVEVKGFQLEKKDSAKFQSVSSYPTPYSSGKRVGADKYLALDEFLLPKSAFTIYCEMAFSFLLDRRSRQNLYSSVFLNNNKSLFNIKNFCSLEFLEVHNGHPVLLGSKSVGYFDQPSSGDGFLDTPNGNSVDSAGNVYVCDYNNNRIVKFTSNGEWVANIIEIGSTPSTVINFPQDCVIDHLDNLYVAVHLLSGGAGIVMYNSLGVYQGWYGTSIAGSPLPGWHDTSEPFDPEVDTTDKGLSSPRGMSFVNASGIPGGDDNMQWLYIADSVNHKVIRLNVSGVSGDGISNANPEGWLLLSTGEGIGDDQLTAPFDVAVDRSTGDAYIADTDNYRITVYDIAGDYLGWYGEQDDNTVRWHSVEAVPAGQLLTQTISVRPFSIEVLDSHIIITDSAGIKIFNKLQTPRHSDWSWKLVYFDDSLLYRNSSQGITYVPVNKQLLISHSSAVQGSAVTIFDLVDNLNSGFYLKLRAGIQESIGVVAPHRIDFDRNSFDPIYINYDGSELGVSFKDSTGWVSLSVNLSGQEFSVNQSYWGDIRAYFFESSISKIMILPYFHPFDREFVRGLYKVSTFKIDKPFELNKAEVIDALVADYDFKNSLENKVISKEDLTFTSPSEPRFGKGGLIVSSDIENMIVDSLFIGDTAKWTGSLLGDCYFTTTDIFGIRCQELNYTNDLDATTFSMGQLFANYATPLVDGEYYCMSVWARGRPGKTIRLLTHTDPSGGTYVQLSEEYQLIKSIFQYDAGAMGANANWYIYCYGMEGDYKDYFTLALPKLELIRVDGVLGSVMTPEALITAKKMFPRPYVPSTMLATEFIVPHFNPGEGTLACEFLNYVDFEKDWYWIGNNKFFLIESFGQDTSLNTLIYAYLDFDGAWVVGLERLALEVRLQSLVFKPGKKYKFIIGWQHKGNHNQIYVAVKDYYGWHYHTNTSNVDSVLPVDGQNVIYIGGGHSRANSSLPAVLTDLKVGNKFMSFGHLRKFIEGEE